jgi:hypothetical protein
VLRTRRGLTTGSNASLPKAYVRVSNSDCRAERTDYFEHPWLNLVLAAGQRDARDGPLRAGVEIDGLRRTTPIPGTRSGSNQSMDHF